MHPECGLVMAEVQHEKGPAQGKRTFQSCFQPRRNPSPIPIKRCPRRSVSHTRWRTALLWLTALPFLLQYCHVVLGDLMLTSSTITGRQIPVQHPHQGRPKCGKVRSVFWHARLQDVGSAYRGRLTKRHTKSSSQQYLRKNEWTVWDIMNTTNAEYLEAQKDITLKQWSRYGGQKSGVTFNQHHQRILIRERLRQNKNTAPYTREYHPLYIQGNVTDGD